MSDLVKPRVWDVNTLTYVRMVQPVISTDTLAVTISGVATSARQDTGNTSLASIDGKITAVDTGHVAVTSALPTGTNVIGHVIVDSGSVSTTETNSASIKSDLDTIAGAVSASKVAISNSSIDTNLDTKLSTLDTDVKQISTDVKANVVLAAGTNVIGHVIVDSAPASTVTNDGTFAKETGGNLDSLVAKDFATQTTLATLAISQGSDATTSVGPLIQGYVNDTVASFNPSTVQPIQLATDGRLRVVTASESYNFTPWGSPESWGDNGFSIDSYFSAW